MDGLENVTGVEAQGVTEPATQENVTVNQTEDAQNAAQTGAESTENGNEVPEGAKAGGKTEEDARFASVRRKAEEDARAKYEAQQQSIDSEFKRLFGNYKNPQTGKPIENVSDYLVAIQAQQKQAREEELRAKGVNPELIEEMINNSPIVKQAESMIQQNMQAEAARRYAEDLKALSEIDPSIKSEADLMAHPSYPQVYEFVSKNGLSLPDAYRLANYNSLSAKNNAAVRQAAINQAKGKNHLEATGAGMASGKDLQEVPASTLARMREFYPDLTDEQIKVKYNETL